MLDFPELFFYLHIMSNGLFCRWKWNGKTQFWATKNEKPNKSLQNALLWSCQVQEKTTTHLTANILMSLVTFCSCWVISWCRLLTRLRAPSMYDCFSWILASKLLRLVFCCSHADEMNWYLWSLCSWSWQSRHVSLSQVSQYSFSCSCTKTTGRETWKKI